MKKVKEPKYSIEWEDRAEYNIYKTRIVKVPKEKYRLDGCYKKWFGLVEVWVALRGDDYDKALTFRQLKEVQKLQKTYIKYYEDKLAAAKEHDTIVEVDVVKTVDTHPEHFV